MAQQNMFFSCRREEGEVRCNPNQSEHCYCKVHGAVGKIFRACISKTILGSSTKGKEHGAYIGGTKEGQEHPGISNQILTRGNWIVSRF